MAFGPREKIDPPNVTDGTPFPLGATVTGDGVNFSIFSSHATAVSLLLFETAESPKACRTIALDPGRNWTSHYWHIHVEGVGHGQVYAYRIDGPSASNAGHRFDASKVLIDPYAKAVCSLTYSRQAAIAPGDNEGSCMRSAVVASAEYDWEGDRPLRTPFHDTVIYELHVGGFTQHPTSGLSDVKRGTYAGLVEKIPYLLELGITAVEFMPIFQFDVQDGPETLENYWGYSPVSLFAPHQLYSSDRKPLGCVDEFRDMVKALHRAGLEVILDVVYNHTAEGGAAGPTFSFKGIDNKFYYMLSADSSAYADYTGTGNTLNTNQSVLRRLILDSLRYWVSEMHVDGFRFDLASVLSRDEHGRPVSNSAILWDIDSDPVLAGSKLMAEAWDAGGLYQVGSFAGDRWKEWNGRFRDDVRSFVRGDRETVKSVRLRMLGSPDLYSHRDQLPEQSINFVTCHDGFTLNDLVSFDRKHNEMNRQQNLDGSDDNRSWNCGEEGHTDSATIEELRERQIRNFLAITLLSLGTPLLLMGDEVRRTQRGNNNPYCQNNLTTWFDWGLCEQHRDLFRYVQLLIRLRKAFSRGSSGKTLSLPECLQGAKIIWGGVNAFEPDLSDDSHSLAATIYLENDEMAHLILNMYWESLAFALPQVSEQQRTWRVVFDTTRTSPGIGAMQEVVEESLYDVGPRSVALLWSSSFSS